MRRYLLMAVPFLASLVMASSAQAVVVDLNPAAAGHLSVTYPTDQSYYYGVALVPGTRSTLVGAGVPTVATGGSCNDPALASGQTLPSGAICFHSGGSVMHANETFALTWEPDANWGTTVGYVEQFLKDVADGSGTLSSPYAVATQYTDGNGRAGNTSKYGGGCVDQGVGGALNGSSCDFASSTPGPGHNYPSNGCTPSGSSSGVGPNVTCLTDAQLESELQTMIPQTGMLGRTEPNYSPLVVMMLPPEVEVCLNSTGTLCSANSDPKTVAAQFCSYHGQVAVGGTEVPYIVQPWTAYTACDEPDSPALGANPSPQALQQNAGARLVSPLSQAQIATMVNPAMNGWFADDGSEINDNTCAPLKNGLDSVSVGGNSYLLQREFNNASTMVFDPSTYFGCAPNVILTPSFVVPSAINQGDLVEFDGSPTASTLIVPSGSYQWNFGDGTTASGPSVEHAFEKGGTYTVTLTVTDRGGNQATLSQPVQVLSATGQPVITTLTPPTSQGAGRPPAPPALSIKLQLLPQALRNVLRKGIALRVQSNMAADGFATISISRKAARRAKIKLGRRPIVVIGTGTVSSIRAGSVILHLRMSRVVARKLSRLRHLKMTVRLALVASNGHHFAIDVAGKY